MKTKEILIDVTYTNLLEDTKEENFNLCGELLSDSQFVYYENKDTMVEVFLNSQILTIHRKGQMTSNINCDSSNVAEAKVTSEHGIFTFDVKTELLETEKDKITVQYALFQNNQKVSHLNIMWKIKEGNV